MYSNEENKHMHKYVGRGNTHDKTTKGVHKSRVKGCSLGGKPIRVNHFMSWCERRVNLEDRQERLAAD